MANTDNVKDPFEYLKTRSQLHRNVDGAAGYKNPAPGRIYYKGCSAIILGNSIKALARYSVYTSASKFMADADGVVSAPQIVVAGMFTGVCESIIVVPFESE